MLRYLSYLATGLRGLVRDYPGACLFSAAYTVTSLFVPVLIPIALYGCLALEIVCLLVVRFAPPRKPRTW